MALVSCSWLLARLQREILREILWEICREILREILREGGLGVLQLALGGITPQAVVTKMQCIAMEWTTQECNAWQSQKTWITPPQWVLMQHFSNMVSCIHSEASPKCGHGPVRWQRQSSVPVLINATQLQWLNPLTLGGGGVPASFLEFDQFNVSDQCGKWVKFVSCANGLTETCVLLSK